VTGSDVTGSDVTGNDVTGNDVTGNDVTGVAGPGRGGRVPAAGISDSHRGEVSATVSERVGDVAVAGRLGLRNRTDSKPGKGRV
jgi:hypothetical protein